MQTRYRLLVVRSLVLTPLVLVILLAPASLWPRTAVAVADFTAPMPVHAAEAAVTAAQQTEQTQRTTLARQLGARSSSELATVQSVYVSQTGFHVSDRSGFLSFWRRHGGVLIFGYPIGEEIIESRRIVQYFERARFEAHPEQRNPEYRVQLARLSSDLTRGRDFAKATPDAGERFFPETGHSISGAFYDFWRKRGGLSLFGYPVSEPIQEVSSADGQTYTVQYFERARFEHHPEELPWFYREQTEVYGLRLRALYEVQLGDLGRQMAERRGYRFPRSLQRQEAPDWSPLLKTRRSRYIFRLSP